MGRAFLPLPAPDRRFGGQFIATHSAQKPLSATAYVGTSGPASICTGVGGCFRPGGFTILDATAYVKVGEIVTIRAGIFNIFDRKYAWWSDVRGLAASSAVTDAYTQPGRNASVSLTARF